jgi:hypothetical protein
MAQLRLTDLEPERPDDHVTLHIRNPEGVDFGQSSSTSTTKPTIVILPTYSEINNRIPLKH